MIKQELKLKHEKDVQRMKEERREKERLATQKQARQTFTSLAVKAARHAGNDA